MPPSGAVATQRRRSLPSPRFWRFAWQTACIDARCCCGEEPAYGRGRSHAAQHERLHWCWRSSRTDADCDGVTGGVGQRCLPIRIGHFGGYGSTPIRSRASTTISTPVLSSAPLSALPVLTKQTLMESFDSVVTRPGLRLVDVEDYLATAPR